jgi:hypothetical protein
VGDHWVTVTGEMDVELQGVGTIGEGALEGLHGVLRQQRGRPAMPEHPKLVFRVRHLAVY